MRVEISAGVLTHRILSAVSSCSTYWRLFGAGRPDSWRPFRFAVGREYPALAPMDSRRTRTRQPDIPPPLCTIPGTRTTTDSSRCSRWCRDNRNRWVSRTPSWLEMWKQCLRLCGRGSLGFRWTQAPGSPSLLPSHVSRTPMNLKRNLPNAASPVANSTVNIRLAVIAAIVPIPNEPIYNENKESQLHSRN